MSDLDHLEPRIDAGFAALTRDLAHSSGPGAAAALATVRRRRRTRVRAVAVATLVVVGGGLTVPRLLFPADGVAADGGSARLDTTALERATDGWIDGWETWTPSSPHDVAFGMPSCLPGGSPDTLPVHEAERTGFSTFITPEGATARVTIASYPDAEGAAESQALAAAAPGTCGTTTTYVVDGVEVRHQSMPRERSEDDAWLGDIWSVRIGTDHARLDLAATTDLIADGPAEDVAELLVAGLRAGWTQTGMKAAPVPEAKGPLPEWSDVDLQAALAGWRSPTRRAPTTSPNLLCLHDRLDGPTTSISSGGGSQWGLSYRIAGYDDPIGGQVDVERVLDELRACTSADVTVEALPNGAHLATYDTGGPEPENAIWLAAAGDRAGLIAVERADRPMPASARMDVADALVEILAKPW